MLLRGGKNEAKSLVKAAFWPLKNLKKIWQKRVQVQSMRKVSDDCLVNDGLLLSVGNTLKLRAQLKKSVVGQ